MFSAFILLLLILLVFAIVAGLVMVLLGIYLIHRKSPYLVFRSLVLAVGVIILVASTWFFLKILHFETEIV